VPAKGACLIPSPAFAGEVAVRRADGGVPSANKKKPLHQLRWSPSPRKRGEEIGAHGREEALKHWCLTHQIKACELNLVGYEDEDD
jgi:hypothetical protein